MFVRAQWRVPLKEISRVKFRRLLSRLNTFQNITQNLPKITDYTDLGKGECECTLKQG